MIYMYHIAYVWSNPIRFFGGVHGCRGTWKYLLRTQPFDRTVNLFHCAEEKPSGGIQGADYVDQLNFDVLR